LLLQMQGHTRLGTAIDPQPVSLQPDAQAGVVRHDANRMNNARKRC
jgi:hypothetical protein